MKLTATKEDYLRAIYLLREEQKTASKSEIKVRGIDIAKTMGLAKSTVSERLKELLADRWILENETFRRSCISRHRTLLFRYFFPRNCINSVETFWYKCVGCLRIVVDA